MNAILLSMLLFAPSAHAVNTGKLPRPDQTPAAGNAPVNTAPDAQALTAQCSAQVKTNPFEQNLPRVPANPPAATQEISSQDAESLVFNDCNTSSNGADQKGCNTTLGQLVMMHQNDRLKFKEQGEYWNAELQRKVQGCASNQTTYQQCVGNVYREVAGAYRTLASRFAGEVTALNDHYTSHLNLAQQAVASHQPASTQNVPAGGPTKYVDYAKASAIQPLRASTSAASCGKRPAGANDTTPFCAHIIPATEAHFYYGVLATAKKMSEDTANCFDAQAQKAAAAAGKNGPPDNGNNTGGGNDTKKGGLGLGGMGLDDLMKMATLGITGGALYCSVTKKCSPSSSSSSDTNSDTSGATAPTPNAAQGPETSSMGDNKTTTASLGQPPSGTGAAGGDSSGGHYGSSSGYDQALQHFNGALDSRAPASTSAPSTGASSGGSFAGIGGNNAAAPAALPAGDVPKSLDLSGMSSGLGGLSGGGGSAGFNLGDAHGATPADSALKNILNGDLPTSTDVSLLPGADAGAGAGTQAAGDAAADPESLFSRVRGTHERCLKRGCVGQGVGDNI